MGGGGAMVVGVGIGILQVEGKVMMELLLRTHAITHLFAHPPISTHHRTSVSLGSL